MIGQLCSARNLIVLNFRLLFMPLPSPLGIRDADRPEQVFLPPGDHTEYGDLKYRHRRQRFLCSTPITSSLTPNRAT